MKMGYCNFGGDISVNKFISASNGKYTKAQSVLVMIMDKDDSCKDHTIVSFLEDADIPWVGEYGDEHVEHYLKGSRLAIDDAIITDKDSCVLTDYAVYNVSNQDEICNNLMNAFSKHISSNGAEYVHLPETYPDYAKGYGVVGHNNQHGDWHVMACIFDDDPREVYYCSDNDGNYGVVVCDDLMHADPTDLYPCSAGYILDNLAHCADTCPDCIAVFDKRGYEELSFGDFTGNYNAKGERESSNGYYNVTDGADFGNGLHYTKSLSIPVTINDYNGNPNLCHIYAKDNYDIPLMGNYKDSHTEYIVKNEEHIVDISKVSPKPLYDVVKPVSTGKSKLNAYMAKYDSNHENEGVTGPSVTD